MPEYAARSPLFSATAPMLSRMTRRTIRVQRFSYVAGGEDDGASCHVHITATWYRYVEDQRAVIDLKYNFRTTGARGESFHPLREHPEEDAEGVIVAANRATEEMVAHLFMSDQELAPLAGLSTPSEYRGMLIRAMAYLWD